jgi:hypothetical protein
VSINIKNNPSKPAGNMKFTGVGGGVKMSSSSASPSFSPDSLSGLVAWFDASQITGYSDNAMITEWPDLSINANHLDTTTQYKPRWRQSVALFNGQPAVYFGTETASNLYRSSPTGLPTGSSPHTTYVVFSQDFSQETRMFGWGNNITNPGGRHSLGVTVTGTSAVVDGLSLISTLRPISSTTPYIYSSHYGSGLLYSQMPTYLNGVYDMGVYLAYDGTLYISLDTIGMGMIPGYTAGYFLTGYVAEAILYNVLHTTEERNQVHGYLSAKYGISI